ncbi:MAG: hypothetical protein RMY27_30190 [Nostoc sp. DedQUE09]|nr:hypothetical protein [Nostoc sp. DedQUE09]
MSSNYSIDRQQDLSIELLGSNPDDLGGRLELSKNQLGNKYPRSLVYLY